MENQRKAWLMWLIILIFSAYIVPYFIIDEIEAVTGPFLYWTIYAVAAIISTFLIINKWRN